MITFRGMKWCLLIFFKLINDPLCFKIDQFFFVSFSNLTLSCVIYSLMKIFQLGMERSTPLFAKIVTTFKYFSRKTNKLNNRIINRFEHSWEQCVCFVNVSLHRRVCHCWQVVCIAFSMTNTLLNGMKQRKTKCENRFSTVEICIKL